MAKTAKKLSYSMTHIKSKIDRKTNPKFIELLHVARKQKAWMPIAHMLSGSTRAQVSVNLSQIDSQTKAGDTILVPGKILASGDLTKKVRICALSISKSAMHKLKATKSEYVYITEEVKSNPKAEGIKVIVGAANE